MFIMPAKGRITSLFGMRNHPISKTRAMHWGIDIGNHADNNIEAAAAGKFRLVNRGNTGYGYYVIITHSNGWETLYAHLASISVAVGNTVKQGQRIGVKGTTGNSTGVHLHFEVHTGKWNNSWSNAKNPLNYISDAAVKQTQLLLVSVGYNLVVDGISGAATDKAVRAFQKANKLTVDGIVGKATTDALKKATPKENLVVDGYLGKSTYSAMQRYFGTFVDGVISKPSPMIKGLQKLLGVTQDGCWGADTNRALQRRFGTFVDGVISRPSPVIKELQRRLNKGKL